MFDPDNAEHMKELVNFVRDKEARGIDTSIKGTSTSKKAMNNYIQKKPLSQSLHKLSDKNNGKGYSELESMLTYLEELGYGGQIVKEAGNRSPMIFRPEDIKSVFNTSKYNVNSRDILNSGLGLGATGILGSSFIDKGYK